MPGLWAYTVFFLFLAASAKFFGMLSKLDLRTLFLQGIKWFSGVHRAVRVTAL